MKLQRTGETLSLLRPMVAFLVAASFHTQASEQPSDQCTNFTSFESSEQTSTSQEQEKDCPDQTASTTGEQTTTLVSNISGLISLARGGFGAGDNRTAANAQVLGGAAGEGIGESGRLSPYMALDYSDTERRPTNQALGYDQEANSLVLGTDYRITDSLIAGATLAYMDSDTDFDDNSSNTNETLVLGVYASQYWDRLFVDALVTYGQVDLKDIERVAFNGTFEGDTDGDFHSAEITAGLNFNRDQWRVTPTVRVLHVRGELDGYTESVVSDPFNTGPLTFDDTKFDSLEYRAALQADYVVRLGWGVLIPSLNLAYFHEHLGADNVLSTSVATGTAFQSNPEDPEKNFKEGRLGLSAQFQGGLSGFFSYSRLIDHSLLDRDRFALGVRYELP